MRPLAKRNHGVLLDRDGVLSRNVFRDGRWRAARRFDEFELLPGVHNAVARLHAAGISIGVVTNQPDIGAGTTDPNEVLLMHQRLRNELNITEIHVCPHVDAAECECRKPLPALLARAATALHLDLPGSYMVGDRWRDIEAGRAAGCRTVLIGDGAGEHFPSPPDLSATDLHDAVEIILNELPNTNKDSQ